MIGRIFRSDNDPCDLCGDDRICTRPRLADMAARFQRYIHRRVFAVVAFCVAICNGVYLRVPGAEFFVIPLADNRIALYDHASNRRVRLDISDTLGRKFYRTLHVFDIIH